MKNIEYEIKLNEDGKPYVHLEDTNLDLEDRFFCLEIARYMLFEIVKDGDTFPDDFKKDIAISGDMVGGLANKIGDMILERDKAIDNIDDIINPTE